MRSHWYHAPGLVLSGPRGRSQAWFLGNVARNSPAAASNLEFASLELQRFERRLKTDRGKLCATFIRRDPVAPSGPPAPSTRVARCGPVTRRVGTSEAGVAGGVAEPRLRS